MLKSDIELVQAERAVATTAKDARRLSEQLGELNAEKAFTEAGYQKPGLAADLKRIPSNGGNVRQGIDQGYRSMKPFQGADVVVEAKGLARPPANPANALQADTLGFIEGAENWNLSRLQDAASSGNVNAQRVLARLAGDAPESFLSTTNVTTGQTTISQLEGASGRPIARPVSLANVSPVGEMVGTTIIENTARNVIPGVNRNRAGATR
jgi:hypothetical protein